MLWIPDPLDPSDPTDYVTSARLNDLVRSSEGVVFVDDATDLATRLGELAAAGQAPSTTNPVVFYQSDLAPPMRLFWTVDGNTFHTIGGPPRTVNRWRQMAATNTFTNQTSFAQFPQAPDHSALSIIPFVKQSAGTDLLVTMHGSCRLQAGVAQTAYLGIYVSALDEAFAIGSGKAETATFGVHISGSRAISGVPAGATNLGPRFRASTASGFEFQTTDVVSLTVQEVWPG